MKKINWKSNWAKSHAYSRVGCITMYVISRCTRTTKMRWFAEVLVGKAGMGFRSGPLRKSIAEAKKDAVNISREILSDYRTCIDAELKNWE